MISCHVDSDHFGAKMVPQEMSIVYLCIMTTIILSANIFYVGCESMHNIYVRIKGLNTGV